MISSNVPFLYVPMIIENIYFFCHNCHIIQYHVVSCSFKFYRLKFIIERWDFRRCADVGTNINIYLAFLISYDHPLSLSLESHKIMNQVL